MNRREFSAVALASGLLPLGSAHAQTPTEGQQYSKIEPPVPPTAQGKVEVVEFFSYACPHCAAFEPTLEPWAKKLPADVAFHRIPVPFLMNAENFMRTYYALETLGQVDAVQRKIFNAVHVERLRLDKPADIAAWMAKNGVDEKKFTEAFNSFSVATSVTRAKKAVAAYKIDGVPTLAVNGRYATSPSQAGGAEQALAVTDFLIQRARKGA